MKRKKHSFTITVNLPEIKTREETQKMLRKLIDIGIDDAMETAFHYSCTTSIGTNEYDEVDPNAKMIAAKGINIKIK